VGEDKYFDVALLVVLFLKIDVFLIVVFELVVIDVILG
jgi:hypothetical protein